MKGLENEATSQLILQPFRRVTYVIAHSTTLPLHHVRHRHFTYVTWWAAHVLNFYSCGLRLRRRFTCVTAHSPTLPSRNLRRSSFYNPSIASSTAQALHLRHLASRPFIQLVFLWSGGYVVALPTSQLILQSFRRVIYVTANSTSLPFHHQRHMHFTYVTWRAAHVSNFYVCGNIVTSHAASPDSIPGRVNFLVEVFSGVFPQP